MNSKIQKDKLRRKNYLIFEMNRFVLKSIVKNKKLFFSLKYNATLSLDYLFEQNSKNKINNYCIYTFRKKSLLNKFKMSRIIFLNLSRFGQIFGIKKAVW